MTVTINRAGGLAALVQVWSKGYRVTQDGEEFQRYVPSDAPLMTLEASLAKTSWGRTLEPLYGLTARELSLQRCVLFDASHILALMFAPTTDKHGRPSLVLTSAATPIEWERADIHDRVGRTVALAARLATSYADVLRGNPPGVGRQLRSGAFLPSREFSLGEEVPDASIDWDSAMGAVKLWRGITGLCTPRLTDLGANVVLGTKHEAEAARRTSEGVDGYLDVRDAEIRPLTSRIDPWRKPAVTTTTTPGTEAPQPAPDLTPIVESLHRMERTLDRMADLGGRVLDAGLRLVDHLLRDRRKR